MPQLTKKAAYFRLQSEVCDLLPPDAVTQVVRKHEGADVTRAKNVVDGMTKDLGLLVKIVQTALPSHQIDKEILAVS
jgi:hypothetical protein